MSAELKVIEGLENSNNPEKINLHVTSFFGGKERGKCLQLTFTDNATYGQLTREQVRQLCGTLSDWLLSLE